MSYKSYDTNDLANCFKFSGEGQSILFENKVIDGGGLQSSVFVERQGVRVLFSISKPDDFKAIAELAMKAYEDAIAKAAPKETQ